jgi:cation diffusion facilitator family transporter
MHTHSLETWQHRHDFAVIQEHGEKRTRQVLIITAITMLFEIFAGMAYGSMALLADGWHMGTHVAAFLITIFAYHFAKKHANNATFAFGTGKVGVLGGFASAIALIVVALLMLIESGQRIFSPQPIHFNEAIGVAALGLLVNIACAFLLRGHHEHGPAPAANDHDRHHHHHPHDDHNLKAAYLHVLADALTSVLAIAALIFGKYLGWNWLDPLIGIVGAAVISRWAYGLLRETGAILLDGSISGRELAAIKEKIEGALDNRVADMHVWKVGPAHYAAIISIVTHYPQKIGYYQELLRNFPSLAHLTFEIQTCEGEPCLPQ